MHNRSQFSKINLDQTLEGEIVIHPTTTSHFRCWDADKNAASIPFGDGSVPIAWLEPLNWAACGATYAVWLAQPPPIRSNDPNVVARKHSILRKVAVHIFGVINICFFTILGLIRRK